MNLVDDTPIVPGDAHPAFGEIEAARQVLNDAEDELRHYELHVEPIQSFSGDLGVGALASSSTGGNTSVLDRYESNVTADSPIVGESGANTDVQSSTLVAPADGEEIQEPIAKPQAVNAV